MKALTYMILALGFSLSGCSSQKKLVENPPFQVGDATCQSWVGGRAESGSGIKLEIPIEGEVSNGMFKEAFFRGKAAFVSVEEREGQTYAIANFVKNAAKPDMVMHSDSKKEVGNQPPKLNEKIPFKLEADECVLSYMDGDELKYYKLKGIKEKKPLIYQ